MSSRSMPSNFSTRGSLGHTSPRTRCPCSTSCAARLPPMRPVMPGDEYFHGEPLVSVTDVAYVCKKTGNNIALLVESVGANSTLFIFVLPSATYFLSAATKSRQKRPLSNAERLAQRKSLWRLYLTLVAFKVGCHKHVRCETDSRAVRAVVFKLRDFILYFQYFWIVSVFF